MDARKGEQKKMTHCCCTTHLSSSPLSPLAPHTPLLPLSHLTSGKRNLEAAIASSGIKVDVQWKPYFLSLNTPPEGEDLMEHLESKYGKVAVARFNAPGNPMDEAGDRVGIRFNKARRFVNTMDGHRLMEWCNKTYPDKADTLMEALFHAYFEQGLDISKTEELLKLAHTTLGGAGDEARAVLASTQYRDEVLAQDEEAKSRLRVSGVPYYIIESNSGGKPTAFSGAQPADMIAEVLEQCR